MKLPKSFLGFLLLSGFGSAEQKPNILFILIDDLGWSDVGCYGSTFHETPHIDRLAKQGMKFSNAYAASAICSPTRASILTGKYPSRPEIGITRATPQQSLPLKEITYAEVLKREGYATAHIGKWHLHAHKDKGKSHYPEAQGFDLNIAGHSQGQPASFFYPYKAKAEKYASKNVPDLEEGGADGEYLTDRLTDEAIKFVKKSTQRGKPFLLNMWYYTVHTPVTGKPDKIAKYAEKAEEMGITDEIDTIDSYGTGHKKIQNYPEYAAMVESMDENVGRLLACLKEQGIADNTMVIFTSDNGGLSSTKITSNLPLRGGKAWIFEGGIREPLIIKYPGVTKSGTVCDEPVISTDFYPTILAAVGLDLMLDQHKDGLSLLPLLKDSGKTLKRDALYFHLPVYHHLNSMGPVGAVRSGDYKLIQRFEEPDNPQLYNLKDDIGEMNDLAKSQPELTATLKAKLEQWQRTTGAVIPSIDELKEIRAKANQSAEAKAARKQNQTKKKKTKKK